MDQYQKPPGQNPKNILIRDQKVQEFPIVSKQSEEIESFDSFQKKVEKAINNLDEKDIKLPDHCGIYKIIPVEIEIWKEGEFRRHERTLFKSEGKKWVKSYLSP